MKEKLTHKDVGFTQIKNEVLSNPKISWKAKGLFSYLYSKPNDWQFSTHRIKNDSTDGKDSTTMGLRELEKHGYLLRTRQGDGRMNYHITYKPCSENPTKEAQEPQSEKPTVGKSHSGKIRPVSNKELITNKDKETNKDVITQKTEKFIQKLKDTFQGIIMAQGQTEELKKFVSYWTEPNKTETKLRWELQPTWDMKRRVGTWFRNNEKFNPTKNNKRKISTL